MTPKRWLDDVNPRSMVHVVARRVIASRLDRVAKHLRRAARKSPNQAEDIHRLRTWSRRAAAAVALFQPLRAKKRFRWFQKQLKKIRRAAGDVRDLDVMLQHIQETESVSSKEVSPLQSALENGRNRACRPLKKLQRQLGESGKFVRRQERLLKALDTSQAAPGKRLGEWGGRRLRPQFQAFLNLGGTKLSTVEAAHEFRIAAKELRYAIELVGGALPVAAAKAYTLLGQLQQQIGVICDHAAAERMYGKLASTMGKSGRKYLQSQISAEQKQRAAAHEDFLRWWTPRRRAELVRAIAKVTG